MKPKKQQGLVFNNQCNCIVEIDLLEKAMLWYSEGILMSDRVIYLHGKYPAVSIYDEKIHVHRLIAMYLNKSKLLKRIHAHHIDGNKLNASKNNIVLISDTAHISSHNKGRVFTKEHREKIAEAGKKRKGIVMKKRYNINISDINKFQSDGWSINKIAKYYNVAWSTIKNRLIYQNPELIIE